MSSLKTAIIPVSRGRVRVCNYSGPAAAVSANLWHHCRHGGGGSARTEKSVRDNLVTTNICHRALPLLFIHSTHQQQVKFETLKAPEVDDGDGRMWPQCRMTG